MSESSPQKIKRPHIVMGEKAELTVEAHDQVFTIELRWDYADFNTEADQVDTDFSTGYHYYQSGKTTLKLEATVFNVQRR